MKKETLYIILAAIIAAIITYFCTRKSESDSDSDQLDKAIGRVGTGKKISPIKVNLAKLMKKKWGKDTSKYAEYATISTPAALEKVDESNSIYLLCDSENLEDPDLPMSPYDLWAGKTKQTRQHYQISERTFNALVSAGIEADYN